MAKVLAGITTSVDGYITGPNDGPGKGLGEGGERLHYWVFGGPWTYESESKGEPTGEDAAWLAETVSRVGAVVGGRWTYEAAGHWGDENPLGAAVLHRHPPAGGTASGRGLHVRVRGGGGRRASCGSSGKQAPDFPFSRKCAQAGGARCGPGDQRSKVRTGSIPRARRY
jgi:hypothetical protein